MVDKGRSHTDIYISIQQPPRHTLGSRRLQDLQENPSSTPTALNASPWELASFKGKSHQTPNIHPARPHLIACGIHRANSSLREHVPIFQSLGFLHPSLDERKEQLAILDEVSERGRARRHQLIESIDYSCHEFLAHGSDMGQRYVSSAVFLEDAGSPPKPPSDPVLYYEPHTYPGVRLPHAWLNKGVPGKQVSTLDLSGKGRFTLFTGHGGDAWVQAAARAQEDLGIPIVAYTVGFGLQYEAVYNDWYHLREVEEDGCVLVRPDNFVAWRSRAVVDTCSVALQLALRHVLSI